MSNRRGMPLPVQAKLLRVLQNGEIRRLGEDRPRYVDTRIIATTNRNLRDLVRDGAFALICMIGYRFILFRYSPCGSVATMSCCCPAVFSKSTVPV